MWLVFGTAAVVSAVLNIAWAARGKEPKWFRFVSLSATALTLCAFYDLHAAWVVKEDWSALADVVPTMRGMLWTLTILSIGLNGITLFRKSDR